MNVLPKHCQHGSIVLILFIGLCLNSLCPLAAQGTGVPFVMPDLAPAEVEGELEIWAWNIAAASLKNLFPSFNEQYPNVNVKMTMSGANMMARFMLSLSAQVGAPDISQMQASDGPRYTSTGRLTDLGPVAMQYADDFAPSSWANCMRNGKLYAIPWDIGPCGVFYKRSIFKKYDIDPNAIDTWDDYIEAGKKLVERSDGETRMLFLPSNDLMSLFEILMQQNGSQVFDAEGRISINSPKMLQALQVLQRLFHSGIGTNAQIWTHAFYSSFNNTTVATYPTGVWMGGIIKDYAPDTSGDWGVFRLPALYPGGLHTSTLGGSILVIPDQCPDKTAAWSYIKYALCTVEPQIEQYRKFDLFPAYMPAFDHPFFDEPDPFYGGQKVRRLFAQDVELIPILNKVREWEEARRYIIQNLTQWAADDAQDPEALLERIATKLSRRLNRDIAPASGE
jgi:ABC-type glycerol-3-phosphate transport system substrate-binding protein